MCKMPSWWSKSSDSCDREDDDDAKRQKQK